MNFLYQSFLSNIIVIALIAQSIAMDLASTPKEDLKRVDSVLIEIPNDTHNPKILSEKDFLAPADDININEDIPGYIDDYFRCTKNLCRISVGWFEFGALITTSVGLTLDTLSTYGYLSEERRLTIGLASIIMIGISAGLQALTMHAKQSVQDKNATLRELIEENRGLKLQLLRYKKEAK